MSTIPEIRTRRPSGKPPWPMVLLAGAEKCGKSYSAAAFSASELIDRTFWIEIGEGAADQYGALPGARYEIVEHDGTYQGIGRAIYAATMQPRQDGRPHAIVIDSMTELWDLLSDEAQAAANKRKGKASDGEAQITMDLWNAAKKRWRRIIDLLRTYDGPVILTSRLEQVAVMTPSGQPTTAKTLKIRSEKNLAFEVDAIIQIPEPRQYQLTGVRSVHWNRAPGEAMDYPDFTVDGLLRKLGLADAGATQVRSYTAPRHEPEVTEPERATQVARSRPSSPQPDAWAGDAGGAPVQHSSADQPARSVDLNKMNAAISRAYGSLPRPDRLALVAGIAGRPLQSSADLTRRELSLVMDAIEGGDASLPPSPREGRGPVLEETGERIVEAHRRLSEDELAAAAQREAQALAATDEPDAAQIEAHMRDQIEAAGSGAELDTALRAVWDQSGWLGAAAVTRLEAAGHARSEALGLGADAPSRQSWSHRLLAQLEQQGVSA